MGSRYNLRLIVRLTHCRLRLSRSHWVPRNRPRQGRAPLNRGIFCAFRWKLFTRLLYGNYCILPGADDGLFQRFNFRLHRAGYSLATPRTRLIPACFSMRAKSSSTRGASAKAEWCCPHVPNAFTAAICCCDETVRTSCFARDSNLLHINCDQLVPVHCAATWKTRKGIQTLRVGIAHRSSSSS
jgi:hypothetical protein